MWLSGHRAKAQQMPHYTFFTHNYLNYNPAVVGTTKCLESRIGYRQQWVGFQDAPATGFINMHGKFGKGKFNFHGIGISAMNDQSGPFGMTEAQLLYSYHLRLAKKYYWSNGIGFGFNQFSVDYGNMDFEDQINELAITAPINSFTFPIFSYGSWLYRDDRFFGLSIRNVNAKKIKGLGDSKLNAHWTFALGRAIKLNKELVFKPAFLFNYVPKSRISLDSQFLLEFKEKISLGLGGRNGHGVSAMVKIAALKYVTIAYAFDLTANKIRYDGPTSHEITLGFRACKEVGRYEVPCAAYE
jgi:type IX secretion system PorP/SprF family membrane protein